MMRLVFFPPLFARSGLFLLLLVGTPSLGGCAQTMIPNTDVPDTAENREVVDFVERYRQAVQSLDVGSLVALASQRYLDDNGTPVGHDDVDRPSLEDKLARWKDEVDEVRYEIRYRRVTFRGTKVLVDYTYTASFRVETPAGKRWARRLSDNRLVLEREKESGEFRILSGM